MAAHRSTIVYEGDVRQLKHLVELADEWIQVRNDSVEKAIQRSRKVVQNLLDEMYGGPAPEKYERPTD